MRGRCIDPGATLALELNKVYYLFPNGPHAYYVSRFNNPGAHLGCYQAEYFKEFQESIGVAFYGPWQPEEPHEEPHQEGWPEEPAAAPIGLEPGKLYLANLIWRRPGYKQTKLQQYYVRAKQTHGYFYKDPQLKQCGGCFPLHWFVGFKEIQEPESVQETAESVHKESESVQKKQQIELIERENGQLAFF